VVQLAITAYTMSVISDIQVNVFELTMKKMPKPMQVEQLVLQAIQKWSSIFNDMNTRKVWKNIKRSTMPKGRCYVKHKWVFKIKRSGAFHMRLVACGYSQIPGVDFIKNYASIISDVT
jgi:hypothetical protein